MQRTIGKLAEAGGVGVETIRYYQRRGLMSVPMRPGGDGWGAGVRRYDEADLRRLKFIRAAQSAGFTLEEIGELLALDEAKDRTKVRALTVVRIAAIDEKIAALSDARTALSKLAHECAAGGEGYCPILQAFVLDGG